MAQIIRPNISAPSIYRGLDWIFQYTNYDGQLTTWNCGQAASATFLTHHGLMDAVTPEKNMAWLEKNHPPDQLAGYFGTGRRRVERILRTFEVDFIEVEGEDGLKQQLDRRNPVVVMVGLSTSKLLGFDLPGGHWMVAYGYDAERVHLTNWGTMTWEEIRAGWNGLAPLWIRMNGRGLARHRS